MHVQMTAGIPVCAIIHLVGMEHFVDRTGSLCHICKKCITLLIRQLDHLADMLIMRQDQAARMTLLLKNIQKTCVRCV